MCLYILIYVYRSIRFFCNEIIYVYIGINWVCVKIYDLFGHIPVYYMISTSYAMRIQMFMWWFLHTIIFLSISNFSCPHWGMELNIKNESVMATKNNIKTHEWSIHQPWVALLRVALKIFSRKSMISEKQGELFGKAYESTWTLLVAILAS